MQVQILRKIPSGHHLLYFVKSANSKNINKRNPKRSAEVSADNNEKKEHNVQGVVLRTLGTYGFGDEEK